MNPKEKFIAKLTDLLKVKSIVTIICMLVFAYLSITKSLESKDVMIVITAVTTYLYNKNTTDK